MSPDTDRQVPVSAGRPFRHVVLFQLRPSTPRTTVEAALAVLEALCRSAAGVRSWQVAQSLDTRKGCVLVEVVDFDDEAAFEAFRASAAHGEAARFMGDVADWLVGDYHL
jgi:quinol monooxygenase YgiN